MDCMSSIRKAISNIFLPMIILMFILSLYYGWKANGVITGQLLSKQIFSIFEDYVTMTKFQKYSFLQYQIFLYGLLSLGLSLFLIVLTSLKRKELTSQASVLTLFIIIVLFAFLLKYVETKSAGYNLKIKDHKEKIVNYSSKKIERMHNSQRMLKNNVKYYYDLHKELIKTAQDITRLLMNWTILLLTGLGIIIARIAKLI